MPDDTEYVVGDAPPQRQDSATFETKPTGYDRRGRQDTGGGYERWRSYEYRPETAGDRKEDVYVAHHRLLAVVACYPDDMAVGEILDHLDDKDVHHSAPETDRDVGVPWDNRPDAIEVVEHGRHSAITQREMKAWAEAAKEQARAPPPSAAPDECRRCGDAADVLAESAAFEGRRCLDCATATAGGATIEVVE